jgi:hypothetical protein
MTNAVAVSQTPSFKSWVLLAGIFVSAVILVWFSPAERSLGQGIKLVYIHVSLIWTAMVGFTVAGASGAVSLVRANTRLTAWQESVCWVALTWYATGVVIAMAAAKVNWGAVNWSEPLLGASLRFLAAAMLIQLSKFWLRSARVRGGLNAALGFFLMWSILGAPHVMHPQSPIRQSTSSAIKLTFLVMFLLSSLAASWAIWHTRKPKHSVI